MSERPTAVSATSAPGQDVRILLADDSEIFRRGLRLLLEAEEGLSVVGEAVSGREATELAARTEPDVVLIESRMTGRTGLDAVRDISAQVPTAKVVVLSTSDDEADLYDAVKGGALGYLLKDASVDEVVQAVRVVAAGQSLISPAMAMKLISGFRDMTPEEDDRVAPARITSRELDVLQLLARGMNNREIAVQLSISENTVKNHVRNMLEKLGLHSRVEAVMYAVREKLVEIG